MRLASVAVVALVVVATVTEVPAEDRSARFEVMRLKSGLVIPYPLDVVFRGYGRCRRGRHTHRAIDIGGVGPHWGIGTPIRAMARSKVIHIGLPEEDPKRYGTRDTRPGTATRAKRQLPRSRTIPGYGKVHFFTRDYGRHRTGVLVVTRVTHGRLKGYEVKYMHLGAVHPSLQKGTVLAAGQEVGLLGGTAVQTDAPHLHLAIENRAGRKVDPGPLLGIGSTYFPCRGRRKAFARARARYGRKARDLMKSFAKKRRRVSVVAKPTTGCVPWAHQGRFVKGPTRAHRFRIPDFEGLAKVRVTATGGKWRPRLQLLSEYGVVLHNGRGAKRAGRSLGLKTVSTGRRKGAATLHWKRTDRPVWLEVRGWRRPSVGATYTLELERTCPPS